MVRYSSILLDIVKYCMKVALINIFKYSEILNSSIFDQGGKFTGNLGTRFLRNV